MCILQIQTGTQQIHPVLKHFMTLNTSFYKVGWFIICQGDNSILWPSDQVEKRRYCLWRPVLQAPLRTACRMTMCTLSETGLAAGAWETELSHLTATHVCSIATAQNLLTPLVLLGLCCRQDSTDKPPSPQAATCQRG